MKELKNRVKFLLQEKRFSIMEVAGSETQRVRFSRQLNNENAEITTHFIMLILEKFPDLSAEWLLRGEGTMDKSGHFAPHIYSNGGNVCTVAGSVKGKNKIQSEIDSETLKAIIKAKDDALANRDARIRELEQDKELLSSIIKSFTQAHKK